MGASSSGLRTPDLRPESEPAGPRISPPPPRRAATPRAAHGPGPQAGPSRRRPGPRAGGQIRAGHVPHFTSRGGESEEEEHERTSLSQNQKLI